MIEYSRDFRRIQKICGDQPINISRDVVYLIETWDGEDLGTWFFHPCGDGYAAHVNMNMKCRGKDALDSAFRAFSWIFCNYDTYAIYAVIPPERLHVRVFVRNIGMRYIGIDGHGNRIYLKERPPTIGRMAG